ncbi:MAG: outer membrane beta-barrel protein [Patescibacteria group bacterium]
MRRSLTSILAAVAIIALTASAAHAEGRFDRWYAGVNWMNPANTFVVSDDSWQGRATGSLFGVNGGRGLQYDSFYFGIDANIDGGVVETQDRGYVALNGLGGLTFKVGWVFRDRVLLYAGAGPDLFWATLGPSASALSSQFGSGAHFTGGVEVALDRNWSVDFNIRRQRLGDLANLNVKDAWWGKLGVNYSF